MRAGLVRLKTNTVVQYRAVQFSTVQCTTCSVGGVASNFCEKISGPYSDLTTKSLDDFFRILLNATFHAV